MTHAPSSPDAAHASAVTASTVTLHDGTVMPRLGYGVWQIDDARVAPLVRAAIDAGYRSIDTAAIYDNEQGVGAGIRSSDVAREELFVTTKLWNDQHATDAARRALESSLRSLGLEQLDLYLVHWPSPHRGLYVDAWRALVQAREDGLVRAIGVSNFGPEHLDRIIDATGVVPVLNQVELHPYFQQGELRRFHAEHDIATEAWSPLGQGGELLHDPVVVDLAQSRGCTAAQLVLRWHVDLGNVVIPKSATPSRIVENATLPATPLTDDERDRLAALDRGPSGRIGPDPATASF